MSGTVFSVVQIPGERLVRRDDLMFRVPLAVPGPRLYTTSESFGADELPVLYLKSSIGAYLKVELKKTLEADEAESPAVSQ